MLIRNLATVVLLSAIWVGSIASGALIEVRLHDQDDALITRDTTTGLDWLDLTATQGIAVTEILGGAGGWIEDGWRYADTAEVCGLMVALGLAPSPCPGEIQAPGDETNLHRELLGVTFVSPGNRIRSLGFYDDENASDVNVGWVDVLYEFSCCVEFSQVGVYLDGRDPSVGISTYGNFLVRVIPEPSTASLLALGLLSIAAVRRRRLA
jgi:hypothetical protein